MEFSITGMKKVSAVMTIQFSKNTTMLGYGERRNNQQRSGSAKKLEGIPNGKVTYLYTTSTPGDVFSWKAKLRLSWNVSLGQSKTLAIIHLETN